MSRSIVPRGFESVAHPIFFNYTPPFQDEAEQARVERIDFDEKKENAGCSTQQLTNRREGEEHLGQSGQSNPFQPNTKNGENDEEDISHCEKELDDRFDTTCAICLSSMREPVTICSCGHSFCKACLMAWYRQVPQAPSCPKCKEVCHYFVQGEGKAREESPPAKTTSLFAVNLQRPSKPPQVEQLKKAIQIQKQIHDALMNESSQTETKMDYPFEKKKWKRRRRK
mmetsp:Transcript_739/g.942  ORF Transcript_739/g.942 Transcript_739/m.942 type:complete len:226 (+) Transcript_739:87-764(+)